MRRAVFLLATVALDILLASGVATAITYGKVDGNRHPNVSALVGEDEEGRFIFCSGTLIDEDVVLTAAHCTAAIEEFGFEFVGVTFDPVFDLDTSDVHAGTPHTHPEFPGPSSDVKDIAVVVLDEPAEEIEPAKLPTAGLLDRMSKSMNSRGSVSRRWATGTRSAPRSPAAAPRFLERPGRGGTPSRASERSTRTS